MTFSNTCRLISNFLLASLVLVNSAYIPDSNAKTHVVIENYETFLSLVRNGSFPFHVSALHGTAANAIFPTLKAFPSMDASLIPLPKLFKNYSFVPLFGEMEANGGSNFFQGNTAISFSSPLSKYHLDAWKYANNLGHGLASAKDLSTKIERYYGRLVNDPVKSENDLLFLVRNAIKLQTLDPAKFLQVKQRLGSPKLQIDDFRIIKEMNLFKSVFNKMNQIINNRSDELECTIRCLDSLQEELMRQYNIDSFSNYCNSEEPIADMISYRLSSYSYKESLDGNFTDNTFPLIMNLITSGAFAKSSSAYTKVLYVFVEQRICAFENNNTNNNNNTNDTNDINDINDINDTNDTNDTNDEDEDWPLLSIQELEKSIFDPIKKELSDIIDIFDRLFQGQNYQKFDHSIILDYQKKHIPIAFGFTSDELIDHQVKNQEYRTLSGKSLKLGKEINVLLYKLEDEKTIFDWIIQLGITKDPKQIFNTIALLN